jgi:hypothetical protein
VIFQEILYRGKDWKKDWKKEGLKEGLKEGIRKEFLLYNDLQNTKMLYQ